MPADPTAPADRADASAEPDALEELDVVIVGAGLSGVGAAYRLQTMCPGLRYTILEARSAMGGTWDLFRYPGIRSDSDMYTLGYPFRPWSGEKAIADGESIRHYIEDTAREYGIDRQIRYGHRVTKASWSTDDARWTLDLEVGDDAEPSTVRCRFVYFCSGYYRYDQGYQPEFPGREDYTGTWVHPQFWPEDLDYEGKRIVVVGSGATAITLVPVLAEKAAHVTMLQRSPTWVVSLPGENPFGPGKGVLPESVAPKVNRWRSVIASSAFYQFAQRRPELAGRILKAGIRQQLPGYDLDPDFSPKYGPWDQRLCVVPDGDLFAAIRDGRASVVTDHIERFTETGIDLRSGDHLDADIVVSATGLQLVICGGAQLEVDGVAVDPADTFVYRGFMLSGVPNLAICIGYTNASWTLRADISSTEVCKVLNHLDDHGYRSATPVVREELADHPVLDLKSGYVQRATGLLPHQGDRSPWHVRQNFTLDLLSAKLGDVTDSLAFDAPAIPPAELTYASSGGGATG